MFDIAANGGGFLIVNYQKNGYLSAQRRINAPWQDYALLPDVILIQLDNQVTLVDLTSDAPMQTARSSVVTDGDGTRQATLLLPQGTQAQMVFSDGSTQPLTALSVRATEYTVGPNGPKAMPAELPLTSGYTYAVELSADEAVSAGATAVSFNQPLYSYAEDFIGFPVGSAVPAGYYDRTQGKWIASENGRVIKILGIAGGLAQLDTDGDGLVDDQAKLSALNITTAELQQLASLYPQTPKQLWRVPVAHFSPWDYNWPYGAPSDAVDPQQSQPNQSGGPDKSCMSSGASIIECQNQTLGESIPVVSTPFTLNYRSDRQRGRNSLGTLTIPVSGGSIPASLMQIILEIEIAGRIFTQQFAPAANLTATFTWDGLDAYGRSIQGGQPANYRLTYVYPAQYYAVPADFEQSFARLNPSTNIVSRKGQSIKLQQTWQGSIVALDFRTLGVAGWTMDVHHFYSPSDQKLYLGDGSRRSAAAIGNIITTAAGTEVGYSGDGGPAAQAKLSSPAGVAVGPDGSIYIADSGNNRIRRVGTDGIINTVAGIGVDPNGHGGYSGDGGPATQAMFNFPYGVAAGPDGSIYIADLYNHRIRRVGPDGIINTVAGNGSQGYSGDGGPATQASLHNPMGVAVGPDGSIYIADSGNNRIRRVGTDGIITTVAGVGITLNLGDGGPATQAGLSDPQGVAVGLDGSIYIADSVWHRIRRVGTDGIINTVAGTGVNTFHSDDYGYSGDGGPAAQAQLHHPTGVAVGPDGSIYIADSNNNRIRRVSSDGIINTVAGNGSFGFSGDGGLATQAMLYYLWAVAVGPDGSIYNAELYSHRVRRLGKPLANFFSIDEMFTPSNDASELYVFSTLGRHKRTLNGLTGAVIYQFGYDSAGRLTSITDGDGNMTAIERDAGDNPTAIVGPFGQRTILSLDANGYLERIANPAGEAFGFTYTVDGLLTSTTDPRNNTSNYQYDDLGYLVRTEDPAGGSQTLTRTIFTNGFEVARTTALGRTTKYRVEQLTTGAQRLLNTFPDGTKTESVIGTDGTQTINNPDGTVITLQYGPDPRFGMQAPIQKRTTIRTPDGLTYDETRNLTVTLTDPLDPLSLSSLTDTRTINGRTYTSVYDAATRQIVTSSPLGRQLFTAIDTQGRVVKGPDTCCFYPVQYVYDTRGRLKTITNGPGDNPAVDRVYGINYDSRGFLESIVDPLGQVIRLESDPAGRIKKQIGKSGHETLYTYDANGNMTAITPPGRPSHLFTYTPKGFLENYFPPDVGGGSNLTQRSYNLDGQLTQIKRPDDTLINFVYNNAGQLGPITLPQGVYSLGYDLNTGNVKYVTAPDGGMISFVFDGSDSFLKAAAWSGAITSSISQEFDNDFRIVSRNVNDVHAIDFHYDQDGLLAQAGEIALERDVQTGLINGTTLGNVTTATTYNVFGNIERFAAGFQDTEVFTVLSSYDKLGRVVQKAETADGQIRTFDYVYDLTGRLSEVKTNGTTTATYSYDLNGNRLSRSGAEGVVTGTYDDQDRLLQYGNLTYGYTASGELQTKTDTITNKTTSYQYDLLGNLLRVMLPDSTTIDYIVDGFNRRIGKRINGVVVQGLLYKDDLNPVAELDGAGNLISRFVYGSRKNVPDYMIRNGNVYRIISDPLGSPRIVIDVTTGSVTQRMDYDEFGNIILDTNPGFQPFGFAGGIYDQHTNLTRFGTRDYDPIIGRWTTKDLIMFDGGSTNVYAYVWNNPVSYYDPTGLGPMILCDVLFDTGECKHSMECHGVEWWVGWMRTQGITKYTFNYEDGTSVTIYTNGAPPPTGRPGGIRGAIRVKLGVIWGAMGGKQGDDGVDAGDGIRQ
ncbi:MAG TPA: RHS repeat-associated core domain-containing protein [Candidatus Thermoplasmatota archaeon]|nr:RHS repeat-associated core domain-containing protein [Candidatus Thermoplasmatota archaeon]